MNLDNIAAELVRHLSDAAVRAVAIAAPSFLFTLLMRRRAALCHGVWTVVLAGMLALPLLRPLMPPARVQVRSAPVLAMFTNTASPAPQLPMARAQTTLPPRRAHTWQFYAAILYVFGFCLLAARLLAGALIMRRLVRRASPLQLDAGVLTFESSQVRVPITAGCLFPRILLPLDWHTWDDATREGVLAHEAAHVRRRDGLVMLIGAINTCVFWFHPLAWWIKRRLAVLAEHAADDRAMESFSDPQQYATILLAIATSFNGRKHRLLWGGVAMQGGRIAERIERVLSGESRAPRLHRFAATLIWSTAAVMLWFGGALQLQSVARAQESSEIPPMLRLTPEQVAALEQQHATNPDDEIITGRLLIYYDLHHRYPEAVQIILWMIDHHPEWELNGLGINFFFRRPEYKTDSDAARKRWVVQLAQHLNDAPVLRNIASALSNDRALALGYLERAYALDPANSIEALARHYASALVGGNDGQVLAKLETSSDSGLILATVQQMLRMAHQSDFGGTGPAIVLGQVRSAATRLLGRAEQLQPGSQTVVELTEGVRILGSTVVTAAWVPNTPPTIRVAGEVAAAKLITSPAPIYPPDARARGIQGVVTLEVRINAEGRVDSVFEISGDSAFSDAAVAAVKGYAYQRTFLNGKPCAVLTTVEVHFRLNQ